MQNPVLRRPDPDECAEYYTRYTNQVPGVDFLHTLSEAKRNTISFLIGIEKARWDYRYAPGKWTLKEVMLHVIDTERIFAYRALRCARNDSTSLPGFEQDDYVPFSGAENRSPSSIIEEYSAVREATLQLFRHFDEDMLSRYGTASDSPVTPRAIGFILAGHEIHHLNVIRERYLT